MFEGGGFRGLGVVFIGRFRIFSFAFPVFFGFLTYTFSLFPFPSPFLIIGLTPFMPKWPDYNFQRGGTAPRSLGFVFALFHLLRLRLQLLLRTRVRMKACFDYHLLWFPGIEEAACQDHNDKQGGGPDGHLATIITKMGPPFTHSAHLAGKIDDVIVPVLEGRGLNPGSSFLCTRQPSISREPTPPQAILPPFHTYPLPAKSGPE